jgi:hypothetical protein
VKARAGIAALEQRFTLMPSHDGGAPGNARKLLPAELAEQGEIGNELLGLDEFFGHGVLQRKRRYRL